MQSIIRSYRQLVVGALVAMLIMSAAMPASAAAPTEASLSQLQTMLETIKNWFQPQVKGIAVGPYQHVKPSDAGVNIGAGVVDAVPTAMYGGSLTITAPTTIENQVINGCLNIKSSGVVLRNNKITCGTLYPIQIHPGSDNVTVEFNDIRCNNNSKVVRIVNGAKNFKFAHNVASGCDDFFFVDGDIDGMQVLYNYMHSLNSTASSHSDGFQIGESKPTSGTLLIKGNYIDPNNSGGQTGLIFSTNYSAAKITLEDNFIAKFGLITLRCSGGGGDTCTIKNNVFSSVLQDTSVTKTILTGANVATDTFSCNRFEDGSFVQKTLGQYDRLQSVPHDTTNCASYNGSGSTGGGSSTPTPTTTPVTVPSLNFSVQAQGLTATTSFSLNNGCLGYVLDWGDGKTDSFFGGNGPMCTMVVTAVSKAHTYNQGGTYTVKVTPYFGTTAGTAQTKSVTITAPTTTQTDTDRDGIADSQDNCRTVANVNQANFDNDTQGDACDTDDDNDNIPDTQEKTGCVLNPSSSCGSTATTTPGTGGGTATSSNGASLTLTLNPASIATGGKATLSWTSTNVSTCTASGDWTGSKLRSGTQSTGIMSAAGTRTYTLTCTGSSGTVTKSVTLTVTGEGAGTGTSTPATSCVSGGRTYPAGTSLQTIVNPDGSSRTIADASFVCTNGQWVITGSLPTAATGTRVITTDTVNVRSTANGVVVGTQPAGRLGTRSNATPVTAGGYQWVYVNFDTNPDGFVASQFLSTTIPGTTPTAGGMTQAEINAKIQALMAEIVKLQALLAQLQTR